MVRISTEELARDWDAILERVQTGRESFELARDDKVIARLLPPEPTDEGVSAQRLGEIIGQMHEMLGDDAEAFARDIKDARELRRPISDPWE